MGETPTLFLSHADGDRPVIRLFVKLLEDGLRIPSNKIYVTALDRGGSIAGEQFIKAVFDRLDNPATIVLACLSHNFYNSAFCSNEIGAAWIKQRKLFLYTIPPFTYKSLKGVMADRQAPSLGKKASLEEIRDNLADYFPTGQSNTTAWNTAVARFLEHLGAAAYDIERERAGIKRDLFVSTPMSSLSENGYRSTRKTALDLIESLKPKSPSGEKYFNPYYAAANYESKQDFDEKAEAVENDLTALRESQNYILLLDRDVKTSAYFEAGMALAYCKSAESALDRQLTYFVREGVSLPFMMEAVDRKYSMVTTYKYKDEGDLRRIAIKYQNKLSAKRWEIWNIDKES